MEKEEEKKGSTEETEAIELVLFQVSECYVYMVSVFMRQINLGDFEKFILIMD